MRRKLGLMSWGGWITGGGSWAGEAVSIDTAMQLSAFWACARLIAETVATLPVQVLERTADGGKVSRPDHQLYALLHDSPNSDQTAVEFIEGLLLALLTYGNGYAEKVYTGDRLTALQPIDAASMTLHRDRSDGELRYRFVDRGQSYDMPADKIFHLRGFGAGGDLGLSPVAFARQTLGIAIATEKAAGSTFANGMRASGFFKFKKSLSEPQFQQARANLVEPYNGAAATGKAGILDSDVEFQPVNLPPKDAEMLMSRRFNTEEICRWFGVPPVLVGHAAEGVTAWGTGIETLMLAWLSTGLRRYLVRFEQAARKRLVSPVERNSISIEFNVEGLLRGDSASRAAFISSMVQNGVYSRNRARALENEPRDPSPMADALTVQSNLIALDRLGSNASADAAARDAVKAWLGLDTKEAGNG
ncbi:phage portal protein [Bosea sp. (in: a-proteobacteria)]|uniref:phage portal protein n=1 Tax=Bosea sp. (in: a-proteobacteria) TaxID=1871050 RepID=UPI003B3AD30D